MRWINVKDKLPVHGKGSFLAKWENQGDIMLVCFMDIPGNYVIAGSSGDTCGNGQYPKFSHWVLCSELDEVLKGGQRSERADEIINFMRENGL